MFLRVTNKLSSERGIINIDNIIGCWDNNDGGSVICMRGDDEEIVVVENINMLEARIRFLERKRLETLINLSRKNCDSDGD
jgi:hypothetical protein